ncbi:MAG TPA: hypothetical protein VHR86_04175 [Armatimonadota bacterium]|nr:hypothetical protein [Armatimonadota bacterium]
MRAIKGVVAGVLAAFVITLALPDGIGNIDPLHIIIVIGSCVAGYIGRAWPVGLAMALLVEVIRYALLLVITKIPGQPPRLCMPWTYYVPGIITALCLGAVGGWVGAWLFRWRTRWARPKA